MIIYKKNNNKSILIDWEWIIVMILANQYE
jgi:hypothetical protein